MRDEDARPSESWGMYHYQKADEARMSCGIRAGHFPISSIRVTEFANSSSG